MGVGGIGFFLARFFNISTFHLAILINLFSKYGGKKVVVFPLTKPLAIATVGRLIGGLQNLVLGNTTYNVRFFFTMQRVLNQRCGLVHRQPLLKESLAKYFCIFRARLFCYNPAEKTRTSPIVEY